jgi:serine/threonine protein kinase
MFPSLRDRQRLDLFMSELVPLVTLHHPCVCSLAGFWPLRRFGVPGIATNFVSRTSLADVICGRCETEWWTPTAKAIVVTGIVLAMMEAHKAEVIHGNLTSECILLDEDHRPKICEFGSRNDFVSSPEELKP